MWKKWMIIIVMIFIAINIFFSLYTEKNSYKKFYFQNNDFQYYKKNIMTKIIPSDNKILKSDLNLFQEYLNQNLEEGEDLEKYFLFNFDESINSNNKHCLKLLEKLVNCLSEENFQSLKSIKCNSIIGEEMEELEKCQIDFNSDFDINDYTKQFEEKNNDIFYLNFSTFDKYNKELKEEEYKTQDIIIENKEIETINYNKKKYIINEDDNNENNKNNENLNKDCIEYGLSKDGLLICTKYE